MNAHGGEQRPKLVHILELGGYPDFSPIYRAQGFEPLYLDSMRKAIKHIKKQPPDVIVAEFNFQSDFRDRTSQIESLMASIARWPEVRVIVLYDREQAHQFARLEAGYDFHAALSYPVDEQALVAALQRAKRDQPVNCCPS